MEAVFRPAGGGHQVLARDIARSYKSEPFIICDNVCALGPCQMLFVVA